MELHKFYITDKNGADLLIFSFNMEGVLCAEMENRVCKLNGSQLSIIEAFIESIREDLRDNKKLNEDGLVNILPLIKNQIGAIQKKSTFVEQLILSLSQNGSNVKTPKTVESVLFKNAVKAMTDNINDTISVDELASELNISTSGLKRLFSKYAGMSVHKYFLRLKMKAATTMLQRGMTVSEVSDELGFSSQGYFSAAYKRETGNNPSKVQQNP
jgi:AraC-like DNA-binding protein